MTSCSDNNDDLLRIINYTKRRKYASFHHFYDPENRELSKQIKEKGITETLFEAMAQNGDARYHSVQYCETDPPDCIALDKNGKIVAIEVSELVDEKCVMSNQCGNEVYRLWKFESVSEEISKIIMRKDVKEKLRNFKKVILIIHTDEPDIVPHEYLSKLKCHQFSPTNLIDEVYLLFRYSPESQKYPYVKLCLLN